MKVLVVGGGGREHAICWKLKQDDPALELHAAPGNAGIAELATCHPVLQTQLEDMVSLADSLGVDLVVIGPETPLATGLADRARSVGLATFGPSAAAARIESSKAWSKQLMTDAGVPTATASAHTDADSAKRAARELGAPVVIKASGLAAGKGVIICETLSEADGAIDAILVERSMGESGATVLVEEFMRGEELSVFALTDGDNAVLMLPSQDHKRLLEGDAGPNTGGMGAYAPVSLADDALLSDVRDQIITPTLTAMRDAGAPFSGLLYAGLMLTATGPRVVEFNCRFGDPETQVVLPLLSDNLLELLKAAAQPGGLSGVQDCSFAPEFALTTVIAVAGYPAKPRTGGRITMSPDTEASAIVFHAGTARDSAGRLVSAGGRVFSVTGIGDSLLAAREASQLGCHSIQLEDGYWRRDIGWRELRRTASARR